MFEHILNEIRNKISTEDWFVGTGIGERGIIIYVANEEGYNSAIKKLQGINNISIKVSGPFMPL
jgi:hypothetical protein